MTSPLEPISDWTCTGLGASVQMTQICYRWLRFAKSFQFWYPRMPPSLTSSNDISDWTETWWESSGQHGIAIFIWFLYPWKLRPNNTVKPVLTGHPKRRPTIGFQDQLSLNASQKYYRMLKREHLRYFRPSLSYQLSLRPLFCLFLSGRLR